jgi:hypothetical protein
MFKEIKPNLVIRIPRITHINYSVRVKSIVEPVIHSPPPVDDNIRRNCIANRKG